MRISALAVVCTYLAPLIVVACSDGKPSGEPGVVPVTAWFHTGQQPERDTIEAQVARFNSSQHTIRVVLTHIPEGSYNGQVQAAALARDLPDVLELDGPFLFNYAWQGHLRPLDDLLLDALRADLLPSIVAQGTYRGRLYALGTFDSGLGLFGSRRALSTVGARIPRGPEDAWSINEFTALLERLARNDPDGAVLDLKLNYPGEWFTYAFSPILQSAGGDLIDRAELVAQGMLNGPASVFALETLQSWIVDGYVDPNVDDAAFTYRRVALSWSGHWDYRRYRDALGDDLVVLPLPDFGRGSRSGQGSWVWAISSRSPRFEAAVTFLHFLLRPEEVLAMAVANAAVPGTHTAAAQSELYAEGGDARLFYTQLTEGISVPRPRTPAYPIITSAFQEAFTAIRAGESVQAALDVAAALIDEDIRDNRGYRER
jgi:multiple sugar transport system substrate-binding protein